MDGDQKEALRRLHITAVSGAPGYSGCRPTKTYVASTLPLVQVATVCHLFMGAAQRSWAACSHVQAGHVTWFACLASEMQIRQQAAAEVHPRANLVPCRIPVYPSIPTSSVDMQEWRRTKGINTILEQPQPAYAFAKGMYAHGVACFTRRGQPVWVDKIADLKRSFPEFKVAVRSLQIIPECTQDTARQCAHRTCAAFAMPANPALYLCMHATGADTDLAAGHTWTCLGCSGATP